MKIYQIIGFVFICSLLVNIACAQTNLIKNGDFETGDFEGWITGENPPVVKQSLTDNNYSVGFFFTGKYIVQEIDLTDVSEVSYRIKIAALGPFPQSFDVYIDENLVDTYENITFDWQKQVLKTSELTGPHQLIFSSNGQADTTMNVYIDDVAAYRVPDYINEDQMHTKSPLHYAAVAPFIAGLFLFCLRKKMR